MKRRLPRDIKYAQDGPNGRSKKEIIKRWISQERQRTHRRERREGKADLERRLREE